jgi:kynurenine formamidase
VLAQNGIVLECLDHLDQLPATGTTLVLGMLRLKGGSGTPLSVMAFVP